MIFREYLNILKTANFRKIIQKVHSICVKSEGVRGSVRNTVIRQPLNIILFPQEKEREETE